MSMTFTPAKREQAKLRLGISGPSGSGKTLGALMIAKGIGGRIALIDTERRSASLYSEPMKLANGEVFTPPPFDTLELNAPYTPERFREAVKAAEAGGYDICIIDSMTHEWNGSGGCLEINDALANAKFRGNTWAAWNETTPRHRKFFDTVLQSAMHIIGTMRSKTETAQSEKNGRKVVEKLGMKTEQRDGSDYEFTTVLDIIHNGHFAMASKDRTGLFAGDPQPITVDTGKRLLKWLTTGTAPVVRPLETEEIEDVPTTLGDLGDIDSHVGSGREERFHGGDGIPAGWILDLDSAMQKCDTKDTLRVAWTEAQQECKRRSLETDSADYRLLRGIAEQRGALIDQGAV